MKQDNLSVSALEAVADCERELTARLAEAERQAEEIVKEAHMDATKAQREDEERLDVEAASLRREKEGLCEQELEAARGLSEEKLARLRSSAQEQSDAIVREVVALVLPGGGSMGDPKEAE